jgi:tetratricopeptide (TPR) repeat protein
MARTHRDRATASYRRQDLISTIKELREAVQLCPTEPSYKFMLGNALYRAEALEESANSYMAFLEMRPDFFEAHMSLGFVLFELGDKRKATEQWRIAEDAEPESPFARAALAVGFHSIGDVDNALIQYQRAVTIDPRYEEPEALAIDIRWKPALLAILGNIKDMIKSEGEK